MSTSRKYCIVPLCTNTSTNMPGKRFIAVPLDDSRRKKWLKAVRTDNKYSATTSLTVCEDHFNLEQDAENWIRLQYYPNQRVFLKKDVVPHIFECQPGRTNAQPLKERHLAASRARRHLLQGLLSPPKSSPLVTIAVSTTSATSPNPATFSPSKWTRGATHNTRDSDRYSPPLHDEDAPMIVTTPKKSTSVQISPSKQLVTSKKRVATEELSKPGSVKQACLEKPEHQIAQPPTTADKAEQTDEAEKPTTADKGVLAKPYIRSRHVQCQILSAPKEKSHAATSPFKCDVPKPRISQAVPKNIWDSSFSEVESSVSSFSIKHVTESDTNTSEDLKRAMPCLKQDHHLQLIKSDPMYYIPWRKSSVC